MQIESIRTSARETALAAERLAADTERHGNSFEGEVYQHMAQQASQIADRLDVLKPGQTLDASADYVFNQSAALEVSEAQLESRQLAHETLVHHQLREPLQELESLGVEVRRDFYIIDQPFEREWQDQRRNEEASRAVEAHGVDDQHAWATYQAAQLGERSDPYAEDNQANQAEWDHSRAALLNEMRAEQIASQTESLDVLFADPEPAVEQAKGDPSYEAIVPYAGETPEQVSIQSM